MIFDIKSDQNRDGMIFIVKTLPAIFRNYFTNKSILLSSYILRHVQLGRGVKDIVEKYTPVCLKRFHRKRQE